MTAFGDWLKQRRDELGLTQEELSERVGFSPAMMRKLEAGERRPSGQISHLLADYFRIPPDEREAFVAFARSGRESTAPTGSMPHPIHRAVPWRTAYRRQTNLPAMLTPLIGREREEATLRAYLLQSKTRLLTLTGTAGIGKTRLGLQVASTMVEHFEDGTFFVDLAFISDPDMVIPAIARALGLEEEDHRPLDSALLDYLRERRMLLMLDNFEQVLDAAAALVALMEASPWLKVLVTSREALHVRGERRFPVPPLALPDLDALPPLEELARFPAVELFVERAQAGRPDFELNSQNMADVAAICQGLDGLPLAIELAAARSRHIPADEMRTALSNRLMLLVGGARDLPARHRTLRGAIEWSYNLLDTTEQLFFARLGVFPQSFTVESVEAISGDPKAVVVETLRSLVDKNLVREESAAGRFRLLESVREYAAERLEEQAEADETRRRHAAFFLSLAEKAEQHFTGPQYPEWGAEQVRWIDRLESELASMRAALDWHQAQAEVATNQAKALEDVERGLRHATALRRVWLGRGYFVEGSQRLAGFISMVPRPVPSEPAGLRAAYSGALSVAARLSLLQGDIEPVRPLLEESLGIATELNDTQRTAMALFNLGSVAASQGDYNAARSFQNESLRLNRETGNKWGSAAVLEDLAVIELEEGRTGLAASLLEESLALYRAVGDDFGAGSALASLGRAAYHEGDYARAKQLWEESLRVRREIGYRSALGQSFVLLGWASIKQGDHELARSLLMEGLRVAEDVQAVFTIYWGLVGCGALEAARTEDERAALLFGAAAAFRDARRIKLSPVNRQELDEAQEEVKRRLGTGWRQAWASGQAMTIKQAVALVHSS